MLLSARHVMFVDILCNAQASTSTLGKAGNIRESGKRPPPLNFRNFLADSNVFLPVAILIRRFDIYMCVCACACACACVCI